MRIYNSQLTNQDFTKVSFLMDSLVGCPTNAKLYFKAWEEKGKFSSHIIEIIQVLKIEFDSKNPKTIMDLKFIAELFLNQQQEINQMVGRLLMASILTLQQKKRYRILFGNK